MKFENEVCGGKSCRWTRMDIWCTVMCLGAFIITLIVVFSASPKGVTSFDGITLVTRAEWGARDPKTTNPLTSPVGFVVIHHTEMAHCHNFEECAIEMRTIQDFHMDTRGWDDIGYNFLVAEDGSVYEARGWDRQGAHTKSWNDISLGISIMGNFQGREPDHRALDSMKAVLRYGVTGGHIKPDYKLYGHRDMNPNTECPGDFLYAEIKTWPHFDKNKPVHSTRSDI